MNGTQIIAIDIDPVTGEKTPVTLRQFKEDTNGFTSPPEGLTATQRRRWFRTFHAFRKKGMRQDQAWFETCCKVQPKLDQIFKPKL